MSSIAEITDLNLFSASGLIGLKWYERFRAKSGEFNVFMNYLGSHGGISLCGAGAAPGSLPTDIATQMNENYKRLQEVVPELNRDTIPDEAIKKARANLESLKNLSISALSSVKNRP